MTMIITMLVTGDDCFGANVDNDAVYDAWVLQCVLQCP